MSQQNINNYILGLAKDTSIPIIQTDPNDILPYTGAEPLINKVLRYVKYDTMADPDSTTVPSNQNIINFGKLLLKELKTIPIITQAEECVTNGGYFICAKILANQTVRKIPTIGFVAHMDTAYNYPGTPDPKIIQGIMTLKNVYGIDLRSKTFSEQELNKWISEGVLVSNQPYTILGVKNKAGIAEIMGLCEYLADNPFINHGQINICFTTDAELGKSMNGIEDQGSEVQVTDGSGNPIWIDPATGNTTIVYTPDIGLEPIMRLECGFMDADFAFEVGTEGEDHVEYNSYNISNMEVTFKGSKVPGSYEDEAVTNAAKNAALFVSALVNQDSLLTINTGTGATFIKSINGDYLETIVKLQIKDIDSANVQDKIKRILNILQSQTFYDSSIVSHTITDMYSNIQNKIPNSVRNLAIQASYDKYLRGIVSPIITHGYACAELTRKGIPMISISSGYYNAYTPQECVPIPSLDNCLDVLKNIISNSWTMDFSTDFPEYNNNV